MVIVPYMVDFVYTDFEIAGTIRLSALNSECDDNKLAWWFRVEFVCSMCFHGNTLDDSRPNSSFWDG